MFNHQAFWSTIQYPLKCAISDKVEVEIYKNYI